LTLFPLRGHSLFIYITRYFMPFDLPVFVIPALLYNLLICGLAAATAFHVGNMLERHFKTVRNRD
jgi:hypothetical protein